MLKVLDLFSGIGGFSLGLERSGHFKTVAFCEIDKDCQKVLKKHWPGIPVFDNVKELSGEPTANIDVICGGFPCQDISFAGSRKGITGSRSGLWKEMWRLIDEIRPSYAIIENVEYLRKNGLGVILNDLARVGYDAEWYCITANSVSLPHQRKRLFIVSYPSGQRPDAHTRENRLVQTDKKWESEEVHSKGQQCQSESIEVRKILPKRTFDRIRASLPDQSAIVSSVCRVTDGFPDRLDKDRKARVKQLGNSIVPQIAYVIGMAIKEYEENATDITRCI